MTSNKHATIVSMSMMKLDVISLVGFVSSGSFVIIISQSPVWYCVNPFLCNTCIGQKVAEILNTRARR